MGRNTSASSSPTSRRRASKAPARASARPCALEQGTRERRSGFETRPYGFVRRNSARPSAVHLLEAAPFLSIARPARREARLRRLAILGLHAAERVEAAALPRRAGIDSINRCRVEPENIRLDLGRERRVAVAILILLADLERAERLDLV